ncbi:MAG: hypothetical protein H7X80_04215, partial [bacterium]|nr:hypothetical protein [Candidatus Kapabacteria bacterium]
KRDLLVEQLSLKRHFSSSAATIVPPAHSDLSIMRGLGAVDAGFGGAQTHNRDDESPTDAAPVPIGLPWSMFGLSRFAAGSVAVLLTLGAFGAGYLLRGDSVGAPAVISSTTLNSSSGVGNASGAGDRSKAQDARTSVLRDNTELLGARDSIAQLERMIAGLSNDVRAAQRRSNSTVVVTASNSAEPPSRVTAIDAKEPMTTKSQLVAMTQLLPPAQGIPRASRVFAGSEVQPTTSSFSSPTKAPEDSQLPRWQAGVRNHFRLSLPRVYGLSKPPTATLDRELVATYELGGNDGGILSRVRAGAAVGQTQFGMVFHSNTGGEPIDTIFEISPHAYYGRAFVAPEIIRSDAFAGLLEVGGGYSTAGGFGTVGFNVEYRPVPSVAVHAGASSWLLWSRYNSGVNLSTNVSAHVGAMIGF